MPGMRGKDGRKGRIKMKEWVEHLVNTGVIKHKLKILPKYFKEIQSGNKRFELRIDDRNYQVGDTFVLLEYENGKYTGRYYIQVISYVLRDCEKYGLMDGYCIFCW